MKALYFICKELQYILLAFIFLIVFKRPPNSDFVILLTLVHSFFSREIG